MCLPPSLSLQGYVVLDRPYAFKQWVEKYLDTIQGGRRRTGCVGAMHRSGPRGLPAAPPRSGSMGGTMHRCTAAHTAENYIWMGEPDHVFIRPPPLWATPERWAGILQSRASQRGGWPLGGSPRLKGCGSAAFQAASSNASPNACCSPAAFPFFYIEPPRFKNIIDRFNPKGVPITQFDTIGASAGRGAVMCLCGRDMTPRTAG